MILYKENLQLKDKRIVKVKDLTEYGKQGYFLQKLGPCEYFIYYVNTPVFYILKEKCFGIKNNPFYYKIENLQTKEKRDFRTLEKCISSI